MILNLKNTTFIIVSYKSDGVIEDCIKSLPKNSKILRLGTNLKIIEKLK